MLSDFWRYSYTEQQASLNFFNARVNVETAETG